MGTNYYVRAPGRCANACGHCSESELVHLGKSSVGWKFMHRADSDLPREGAHERWLQLAESGPIEDEYGRPKGLDALLKFIASKQDGLCHCLNNGPDLTGPYFNSDTHWHDQGYDFTDQNFF